VGFLLASKRGAIVADCPLFLQPTLAVD